MSDTTSPPLDTGSSADPSSTNPPNTDPNATNPTDPNASDPNATNPTDPNAGATDPNAGVTDPNAGTSDPNAGVPADPNAGASTSGVGVVDPNAGSAQTTGAASLPNATPNASLGVQTSVTATPTPTPSSIAGSDRDNGGAVVAFDSKNGQYRKAIIIASAVSGAVGLILVVVVIFVVYRRRNRRNRNNATFVNAAAPRPLARTGSDATWIGTRIENGPKESFNEGKLEAGSRTSDAGSIDSDATLADFAAARAKSGAFSTPTHTPRPSLDKLKIANMPMVPEDPFEAPRLSMADRPRPSLEQMINPVPQVVAAPRPRRSGAPNIRINSKGSYASEVVVEQSFDNGIRSPGFPVVPLVTPIEAPAHWRAHLDDEFIPPPPRRDSMASLSRQSSRASSRNSRDLDAEVISPSKKSVFSTITKKRRSRADSIDPFRKSAATMMARRKSRAESMASRKSRAESVGAPKSPGVRRKSRGGSVRRAQSAAANPIFDQTQDMSYSMPAPQVPRTPIGLPQTPRTPTAARRSRVMNGYEPRTPRTPRALPLPPTPRTSGIQQVPRTAGLERPRTPGMERPRTPGMERPRTPGMERPRTPGMERPRTPGMERPRTPGMDRPRTPGTDRPRTPGAERPRTPAAQEPRTPVSAPQPRTPHEQRTPRTPGGRTRQPRAAVPRTPTSLDDAHWDSVPLPAVPPAPVPRPLPSAPLPGGRAELRLSQLSRALSEVSRDSPI